MNRLIAALLLACVFAAARDAAFAGEKKPPKVVIRFHGEGNAVDGEKFSKPIQLLNPPRTTYMSVVPLISEREIKAYYPFQAADGTLGVYFKLDGHGTNLLSQYTIEKRGGYVLVFVNGRHVIDLFVDKPVNDGLLVIPQGLAPTEIAEIDAQFPLIGQEGVRKVEKKAKPVKKKEEKRQP